MKRLTQAAVMGLLLATTAVPMAAEAQNRERRDDRREYRQERREDRGDRRQDRRGDGREFRQERREDRRDLRQGDYDNRREYRQDRRGDRREFRDERRDDRRDFRSDRRDDRQDYRGDRRNDRWDRNNRDWWRGRADFRGYEGPRRGHWYAPGYGYHRVEPRYQGYRWSRGSYLPSAYHRYYVNDPYYYNLRQAPYGHRWVHADNDILLVALATGLIADTVFDIW